MKLFGLSYLSLLLSLGLMSTPAFSQGQEVMTRAEAFTSMSALGPQVLSEMKSKSMEDGKEVMPPDSFYTEMLGMTDNLYKSGFINLAGFNTKKNQLAACVEAEKTYRQDTTLSNMMARDTACNTAVHYNALQSSVPACIKERSLSAGGECCQGLKESVSPSLEATLAGKKSNEECTQHEDCASKICNRDYEEAKGICAPAMSCFKPAGLGQECSAENPFCIRGMCMPQASGVEGVQCKTKDDSCSANSECCSNSCTSGKCADRYICEDCVNEGVKAQNNQLCCKGLIEDLEGYCIPDLPPFILPRSTATPAAQPDSMLKKALSLVLAQLIIAPAYAEVEAPKPNLNKEIQNTWQNDDALTKEQMDLIENKIKVALKIKEVGARKAALLNVYKERTQMASDNVAARKAGKNVGFTMTQEEYVKRYNIPAITPKGRSDINTCTFNTAKDNWIDSPNLTRNAELFLRAFEVSYSGKGTQDRWHLPNQSFSIHQDNLYKRTKAIMSEIRDNRNLQLDQLRYIDMIMACQCIYTFGPEKFDAEKQAFFFSQCTGSETNKVCTDDRPVHGTASNPNTDSGQKMQDTLMLPDSPVEEYRKGREFPNYVKMYMDNLKKMDSQGAKGKDDIDGVDAGASGIGHEEVLVRWLRIRSCNQIDTFMNAERVETKLQEIVKDITLAGRDNNHMVNYWKTRIDTMKARGVSSKVIEYYEKDSSKTKWYRGYFHSESKFKEYSKKSWKFLLFLILALLVILTGGALIIFTTAWTLAGSGLAILGIAAGILGVGGINELLSNGLRSSTPVIENLVRDFPPLMVETRMVSKTTCGPLGLRWCKTYYRILHWPVFSNKLGIENQFPHNFQETRTCAQTMQLAVNYGGMNPNPCSGPFKGTMCAQSFYRPMPDQKVTNKPEYAAWVRMMVPRTLMDPVWPDIYDGVQNTDALWMSELVKGFEQGCKWLEARDKSYNPKAEDKMRFFPDLGKFINKNNGQFLGNFIFDQTKINDYKKAVKKYALCSKDSINGRFQNLMDCGAKAYDGKHPDPKGFGDIFEDEATAELFADYVYQMHFNWRHLSGQAGIGYPLAYMQSYYLTLLHNIRLLTTLTIKKGLELDDAYNRYADDLNVRRRDYQVESGRYGIGMGKTKQQAVVRSEIFKSFRAMGFPLSSSFEGLPQGGALPGMAMNGGAATGQNLGEFQAKVLGAARRHADRVAADNKAFKNFEAQAKKSSTANARLGSARRFFSAANSPVSSVRGMANPRDNSLYSGIGGTMDQLDATKPSEPDQKYAAVVNTPPEPSAPVAADYSPNLSEFALTPEVDASKELANASKVTGMKETDVQDMLDSANKSRDKELQGKADDSLFKQISKAYHRNLELVLVRKKGLPSEPQKTKDVENREKEEIKKLLK